MESSIPFALPIGVVAAILGSIHATNRRHRQVAIASWLKGRGLSVPARTRSRELFDGKRATLQVRDAGGRRFLARLRVGGVIGGSQCEVARLLSQEEVEPMRD